MNAIRAGIAVAAVMALTACGGSSRLSHSEFVYDASRICRHASEKTPQTGLPDVLTSRDAVRALKRISVREQKVISQLRSLDPPKGDATIVAEWIALLDQMVSEVDFARESLRRGAPSAAIEAVARADTLERRGRELARTEGISACRFTQLPEPV